MGGGGARLNGANSACRSVSSGPRAPRLSAVCLPGPCGKAERCEQGACPGRHSDSALCSVVREHESQGRRAAGGREPRSCCRHVQSARSPHRPRSPSAHLPAARADRSVGRRRITLHNTCRGCWLRFPLVVDTMTQTSGMLPEFLSSFLSCGLAACGFRCTVLQHCCRACCIMPMAPPHCGVDGSTALWS